MYRLIHLWLYLTIWNPNKNNNNKTNKSKNNISNNIVDTSELLEKEKLNDSVVDTYTSTTEELFDNFQNKISLEKMRLQDAYQLEKDFYTKPDATFKRFISKLTKADKTIVIAFNEDKTWDLYWKFLVLNRYIPDDFNELPTGIKSLNVYLVGIIRNLA